jgi:XrtN system VIT domain protein
MTTPKQRFPDGILVTGYVLLALSLLMFSFPFMGLPKATDSGYFMINFALAGFYFILLWGSGRLRKGREGLHPLLLFLVLFLVSAYALNRDITVFDESITWFAALQVLLCINYLAFAFFDRLPAWLQHTMCFILGIAMVVFFYLACYLLPLYLMGMLAFFALGISLHTFVPLLFCIYTVVLIRKKARINNKYWMSFGAGSAAVVMFCCIFLVSFISTTNKINNAYRKAGVLSESGLPAWVVAAQQVPRNWVTEKALKADLVYSVPKGGSIDNMFWRMPSRSFGEQMKHDPLVMIGTMLGGRPNISEDNRIKILESLYNARHQAQERLWSGDNLYTEHVKTAVQVWPQLCLSYTEKLVTVTNKSMHSAWNNTEEAIYTFHLPEGAVVTALSLWIEGKEAKGLLTTKEKASQAYRTIVGYERRDPSVVHWQEGNTVSVRVFPVIAGQSRLFKLGFTAPLGRKNGKLEYENVYFDGPSVAKAREDISVDFLQSPKGFIAPASFATQGEKITKTNGAYEADWKIQLEEEPISTASFSFNGKSYTIRPYERQRIPCKFDAVYLDVNATWTKEEFTRSFELFHDKLVYVYDNGLELLSGENQDLYFNKLSENRFSVFPLHVIAGNSLLVSKSAFTSPNLDDLKDSRFFTDLRAYLQENTKVKLFNIGTHLSPYLRSLKEYRVFEYESGNLDDLALLAREGVFAQDIENGQRVVIDAADIAILQSPGEQTNSAPDHLMRLFAYNHIMQQMGRRLVTGEALNEDLVQEAKEAYVVSPVSSLVVLETQQDYDRFNIEESANSLKNASLQSKGAVPEPHEWALIIISVIVIGYIRFKPLAKVKL